MQHRVGSSLGWRLALGLSVGLLAWLSFAPRAMRACNVPVFRYALERWMAYPYLAVIFHRGEMTAAQTNRIHALYDAVDESYANLEIEVVDVGQTNRRDFKLLWDKQGEVPLPWVVLVAPDSDWDAPPVWAGPLDKLEPQRLVDSPARQQLVRRLLSGESAVWVVLESDDAAANRQVHEQLTNALTRIETELPLPPSLPDDPSLRSALPLRVDFSVLPVNRTDPAEEIFVRSLLFGEPVATNASLLKQPLIIPVFGRGVALGVVALEHLTDPLIEEACAFVCGPCSCQVKELNPGKDLLLAADWDRIYEADFAPPGDEREPVQLAAAGEPKTPQAAEAVPNRPAPAQVAAAPPAPQPSPPQAPLATTPPALPASDDGNRSPVRLWVLMGALAGGLIVVCAGAWLLRTR